jgi:PAS domain S-box-containing protein
MSMTRFFNNDAFLRRVELAFVLVLALVMVSGVFYYRAQKRQVRQGVEAELQAIAQLKADQIVAWRGERLGDASVLMENASLKGSIEKWTASSDPVEAEKILGYLRATARYYRYDDVMIVDRSGQVRLGVSGSLKRIDEDDVKAVVTALNESRAVMTDMHICPEKLTPVLEVAAPVSFTNGLVVVLRCDARKYLFPLIQSWPTPRRSAETYLVRRGKEGALFMNELLERTNTALKLSIPLSRTDNPAVMAVMGRRGFVEGRDSRGVECLAVICSVPDSPWHMVAKIDAAEAFAAWRMQSALIMGLIVLLMVVALTVAGFVWQRVKRGRLLHEREAAQEAAQEYLERLQIATRAARIGIWDWNVVTNILFWDDTICELYGVPHGFFKDRVEVWSEYVHPEDRGRVLDRLQAALRGECEYAPEFRITWPDGTIRIMKANSKVFFDKNHKPVRMVGTNIDITERKRAEEEIRQLNADLEQRVHERTEGLEAANKELESFSYSVSHDLRAPLRAVDGFSQVLLEDYESRLDDTGKDYLQRIRASASRMGELIDDMLQLSRISKVTLQRQQVDLHALALGIVDELRAREPHRSVELRVADPLQADADPHLIRIALENLLGNAWKFTSKMPQALIEVGQLSPPAPQVPAMFFVRDNGAGFDMAYNDKLFSAFQRLHRQEEFPGTGVGLATVARIIHRHGGEIRAEGAVGRGATFLFTLAQGDDQIS